MAKSIKSFQDLDAWKVCHNLMIKIYDFCEFLPDDELYNRVSQLKRAASSGPANIAEGYGRYHWQEAIQFCRQARGSVEEVHSNVISASDLKQAPLEKCEDIYDECTRAKKL